MAISKADAVVFFSIEDERKIKVAEERIDETIRARYNGDPIYVAVPGGGKKIVDEITKRYQSVGWKVEYVDDQRDGDALKLS